MDFETLYQTRVEKCSHETAFNKEEARALYNLCYEIPYSSNILEIGVEYGRSTAVLATVGKDRAHSLKVVDPVILPHIRDNHLGLWDLRLETYEMTSQQAALKIKSGAFQLIHIDGSHEYEDVLFDCHAWAPKLSIGGFICFDDYGHPGLEGVEKAVSEYFDYSHAWSSWVSRGTYGNKLRVYKKLA